MSFVDSIETQLRTFGKTVGSFFGFLILHFLLTDLAMLLVKFHSLVAYTLSIIIIFSFAVFMLVWYIRKEGKETFDLKNISKKTWLRALLLCISLYMLVAVFYGYPVMITKLIGANNIKTEHILIIVYAVIGAPVVEEILFRGLLQKKLLKIPWLSILVTSVLFALYHFNNISNILPAFFLGAFCGFIYLKTDKLIICILFHFLYNFTCSIFKFSYNYVTMLQILFFILATGIVFYVIRGFMKDKTLETVSHPLKDILK